MKGMLPTRLVFVAPLLLAIAVTLVVWMVTTVWASFNPQTSIILSSYSSGDNADVTTSFQIAAPDINFDVVVTYTPPQWGVATDAEVPDGTAVGTLQEVRTFALRDHVCNWSPPLGFSMVDATTDTSNSFASAGFISDGTWNGFDDVGGPERAVAQYPDFLKDLFPGVTPRARYYGHTWWNGEIISNVLVFEPGTTLGDGIPSPPTWGYPTVIAFLLDPPTRLRMNMTIVGDWCAPMQITNTTLGKSGSVVLRTNPPYGGTYTFRTWSRGLPDADGDGFENSIDTCPFDPDTEDPKITLGSDIDGIGACDPDPTFECWHGAPDGCECDADGFANNLDNCALVANPDQTDTDGDGIGDACDPNPDTIDGFRPTAAMEVPLDISGPPPPPVGGIAELPDAAGNDGWARLTYAALAGLAAAALAVLATGAWYARRRRLR
jgi:hypothetical protein